MLLHWSFAKKKKIKKSNVFLIITQMSSYSDSTLISGLTASDQGARIMFKMFTAVPQNSLSLVLAKRFFIQFQSSWSRALHLIRVHYILGIKWNLFSVHEEGHVGCSWKQKNSSFFVSKFSMLLVICSNLCFVNQNLSLLRILQVENMNSSSKSIFQDCWTEAF